MTATSVVAAGAAGLGTLAVVPLVAARVMLFQSTTARTARIVGARRMLRAIVVAIVTTGVAMTTGRPGATWCRGEESGGGVSSRLAHGEFLEEELGAGSRNVGNDLAW
jgi:hypothetical protein